jgi:hypothetical protein
MRTIPSAPIVPAQVEIAPIELDDDLTRRDAWMFTPLLAIVIALPIMVSALFAFSAWHIANRDEASLSGPPATFAMRWPEDSLPVLR